MIAPNATVDIASVRDILDDIRRSGATTVDQQLTVLFDKFNIAARAIDPSITGSWVGRDGSDLNTPSFIVFERPGSVFGKGRGA